jgi:hypothetical protein
MKSFLDASKKQVAFKELFVLFLRTTLEGIKEGIEQAEKEVASGKNAEAALPCLLNWKEQLEQELFIKEKEIQDAANSSETEAVNKELQEIAEEQQEEGLPE